MKPERIEELARLAYEATMGPHHFSWKMVKKAHREPWLRIARTLYAEVLEEAAVGMDDWPCRAAALRAMKGDKT